MAPPNPAKGKGPVRSCGMSESRQLVGDGCCEREPREGLCGKGPLTVKRGRGLDDIFVLSFQRGLLDLVHLEGSLVCYSLLVGLV